MSSLPNRRSRQAFTLIELLVVIAIIAVLVGLLLPAVQKVRESAARAKCVNNLKQMGLAFHMYQDQNKYLPTGWVTKYVVTTNTLVDPSPGWSWSLIILPYIEQGNLYTAIGADVVTPGGAPSAPTANLLTVVPIYQCPSDNAVPYNFNFVGQPPNAFAKTNYVVNRWVTGPDTNSYPTFLSVQTISDGASNTVMIGERDITYNVAGSAYIRSSASSASFEGRMGPGLNPRNSPPSTPFTTGSNQRLAYSSLHVNGCNFAVCDGSVHFITNSVDADPNDSYTNFPTVDNVNFTLQKLELPNDGLPVTLPY